MRNLPLVAGFIALTLVCWGVFGPLLELGQVSLHYSALRALICVGAAVSLLGVGVPIVWLRSREEEGGWTSRGIAWGLLAGTAGVLGTLGMVLALKFRGDAVVVLPAVLGLIPVVHAAAMMLATGTFSETSKLFYGAIVLVVVGALGVMLFQPRPQNVAITQSDDGKITVTRTQFGGDKVEEWPAASFAELESKPHLQQAYRLYQQTRPLEASELALVVLSILLAAVCWGSYAACLRRSRLAMEGSRLRPLLVVGVAFLALAVVVPIVLLVTWTEGGRWTVTGALWSLAAGIAAAAGALGLIGALNSGGRTGYILPFVFGGALLVNAIVGLWLDGTFDDAAALFYVSLLLIFIGAAAAPLFAARVDEDEPHEPGPTASRADSQHASGQREEAPAATD